jgi:Domain of unknown function (DUF4160)
MANRTENRSSVIGKEHGKAILFERLTPTLFCRKDDRLEEWEEWEVRSAFEGGAIDRGVRIKSQRFSNLVIAMPELSRFFGIIITLYYNDHPPPHFHVRYGKQKAIVSISPRTILQGELSNRTWNLVKEWALEHQAELLAN